MADPLHEPVVYNPTTMILNCFVQQPSDNIGAYTKDNRKYVEKWKGPTTAVKRFSEKSGLSVLGTWIKVGNKRPNLLHPNWRLYQPPPTLDAGYYWYIESYKVMDVDPAGDHCILEITYAAMTEDEAGSEGGEDLDPDGESIEWSLNWGDRGASVLLYCHPDAPGDEWTKFIEIQSRRSQEIVPVGETQQHHMVEAIKNLINKNPNTANFTSQPYQYVKGNSVFTLNEDTRLVYEKYARGLNPLLHFPIITKTTTYNMPIPSNTPTWDEEEEKWVYPDKQINVGEGMDHSFEKIPGNPFKFPPDPLNREYVWLKVDDSIVGRKTTVNGIVKNTFQRKEQWYGDYEWDPAFYGDDNTRWILENFPRQN